ncbi:unnamed protein product [Dibothriocephalus latus]|uniref:Uncharacterized protein n=1 Tax=Dibothriocephalus latus TaxID=60516 RepID=A0A3P6R9X9_DIBLA|nr:unnamed protein product [Dibothriocephalus latus]
MLVSKESTPQCADSTFSFTSKVNVIQLSLYGVLPAALLCVVILVIVLLCWYCRKIRHRSSLKATKHAVDPEREKPNGEQTQSSPSKGNWGLTSSSKISPGQSNVGPAATSTVTASEDFPLLKEPPQSITLVQMSSRGDASVRNKPPPGSPLRSGGDLHRMLYGVDSTISHSVL